MNYKIVIQNAEVPVPPLRGSWPNRSVGSKRQRERERRENERERASEVGRRESGCPDLGPGWDELWALSQTLTFGETVQWRTDPPQNK